jgi:integrase
MKRKGWLVKRGRIYHAHWKVSGKVFTRSTGTADKREATKRLAEMMHPFLVGDDAAVLENMTARLGGVRAELAAIEADKHPPLTLASAWDAYKQARPSRSKRRPTGHRPDSSEATLRQYGFQFGAFVAWTQKEPAIKTLADVTEEHALTYAAHLKETVSEGTFNKHIGLLQLVWTVLAKPGRVDANPWAQVGRLWITAQSRREFEIDELRRVCGTAEGELRTLLAVGLYTGLRLGDAATLRWDEIDITRRVILRIPNKTRRRSPKPVSVPIHKALLDVLGECAAPDRVGYVMPATAAAYIRRRDTVTDAVQKHFRKCGIQTARPGTGGATGERAVVDYGFHSLRHTFVSLCRADDVPLSVVESIVGHHSPAMTRHYTHTGAPAAFAAVNTLPNVMAAALLPAADPLAALRKQVLDIAEGMTAETLEAARAELLTLAGME